MQRNEALPFLTPLCPTQVTQFQSLACKQQPIKRSHDAVDDVGTEGSTGTKDGGIAQLLANLLAHLLALARLAALLALVAALGHGHGHVAVAHALLGRRGAAGGHLGVLDAHVRAREDALLAGALAAALPPFGCEAR